MNVTAGVFGLQGDVEEHLSALETARARTGIGGESILVKSVEDVKRVDALVIPGGESTVMGGLSSVKGLMPSLRERIGGGLPTLGTCAGMILLAKKAQDRVVGETRQASIGALDVVVERNSFGRQRESFETQLSVALPGGERFPGVFIRAPTVKSVGPGVKELARLGGAVVAVQQGNVFGTAFHPELSGNTLFYEHLLGLARGGK